MKLCLFEYSQRTENFRVPNSGKNGMNKYMRLSNYILDGRPVYITSLDELQRKKEQIELGVSTIFCSIINLFF